MTPFALLGDQELSKSAMLRGLHNLVRGGVWKHIAERTAPKGLMGRAARLFHNPITDKSTVLSKALTGYGLTGLGAQFAGYDLPGSNLAFNLSTPILGSLFTAPSLVTAMRANTAANKQKLQEDLQLGARNAGSDMMSLGYADPKFLTQPGLAQQYLRQNDPATAKLVDQYSSGTYKPMTRLHRMQSLMENPQELINNQVDKHMHGMLAPTNNFGLNKSGMAKAIGTGFSHAFPWLFPTLGVGMLGHSILSDKPYDEAAIRARGYAGGQTKIQQELSGLNGAERFALQLDPSLFATKLEAKMPGVIGQWEQQNKQQFRPGMISGLTSGWKKGGDTDYYNYDAAGGRNYLT